MKNAVRISRVILVILSIFLIHSCKKDDVTNIFKTISDNDGNVYAAVTIGTQTWMKENLKTTKYNDGIAIPLVTGTAAWAALATLGYCWYNNDAATYKTTYGALYNWYTVNTGKLCPTGWHVPGDAEWTTLTTYLGGESTAGGKLKESGTVHWASPNIGATNETGFTALPGGYRNSIGTFSNINYIGSWWSSTNNNANNAWGRPLLYSYNNASKSDDNKQFGFSIRCLKGEEPTVTTIEASTITSTSATVGGNVTADGGVMVIERGLYWGTSQNPESTGTKLQIGSGTGSFSASLSGLSPHTTYYVKAYATNSAGTGYGNEINFTTNQVTVPILTTTVAHSITSTTATSGGNVTSDGGVSVTAYGVCWSPSANPTIALSTKTIDGTGIGTFTSNLTGLIASTTYYVRAYATNSVGTAYGTQVSFTTSDVATGLPTLTTTAASSITSTTATSGGNITSDGGASVTARGICWSTSVNPTIALGTKTTDGTGIGTFISSITGLIANTTYYVRAYATNSVGTAYGTQVSFTTGSVSPVVPNLTTTAASSITSNTATSGGAIANDGGASVTARGVCWNTSANPTIALSTKTTDGTGIGSFTSSITGLTANTTYYVRAYATNSIGTAYGTQVSFTTSSGGQTGTVTDIDGNIYNTITIGTQTWMAENLKTTKYKDGTAIPNVTNSTTWAGLTTGAYCWYNNAATSYGALYNWVTVNTGKLCPTGWHVPGDTEWTTLTTYLGGESAGGKLKESGTSHWSSPNTGATNSSGFTALPGGARDNNGTFSFEVGYEGVWWSSTEGDTDAAWVQAMSYYNGDVYRVLGGKLYGFSVRCLRD